MTVLDWSVVAIYMILTTALGLWLSRRASKSMEEFFVGGRSIPWWLAGASMAATTFNVDTPLYVGGRTITFGIAGNWEWWAFVVAHVAMIYLFARLWRRANIVTDIELIELRYHGKAAALLRGARAFLFALPINAIVIAYGMLAMRKVVDSLGVWEQFGVAGEAAKLWTVVIIAAVVLLYAAFAGLWGVVTTDFFQLVLALLGAIVVAIYAVSEIGGLDALRTQLDAAGRQQHLEFVPKPAGSLLPWETFLAYIGIQWWAFRNADGGGVFIQRLVSVPSEADAERAAWFFNIINYVVRAWPWILVALIAMIVLPGLQDPETAYPTLMLRYLPSGLLGLVFASLLAAFMSTVSSQVNWGASYLVNDVYRRFFAPDASQRRLVWAGRLATLLITALASAIAFYLTSVAQVFQFLIVLGTGSGALLILRWFWWRVNAWAEIAALFGSVIIGGLTYTPWFGGQTYFSRSVTTVSIVTALWIVVMFLTRPEPAATLDAFYARARPGGAWRPVRMRTGLSSRQDLRDDLLRVVAGVAAIMGANILVGALLLQAWSTAAISFVFFALGTAFLVTKRQSLAL
jgi:solute:Na+ symporter, SSS family